MMMKNINEFSESSAMETLQEMNLEEIDEIIGAGNGAVRTLTHECSVNTLTSYFTKCC